MTLIIQILTFTFLNPVNGNTMFQHVLKTNRLQCSNSSDAMSETCFVCGHDDDD